MIRYEYIDQYIQNTIKREEGLLHELELYAAEKFIPIVQPEVARMLSVLGEMQKPNKILEIGTAIGYSAILMSGFLNDNGTIDTIEISGEMAEMAQQNFVKAGVSTRVHLMMGDALDVLKCLNKSYDLIFMDAAKGQYPDFFPECFRMLKSGGLMISDNILYKGWTAKDEVIHKHRTISVRLKEYLKTLCNHPELNTSIIPIGDGVALSYKK